MRIASPLYLIASFVHQSRPGIAWATRRISNSRGLLRRQSAMGIGADEAQETTDMRYLGGIEEVAKDHEIFLLDMWGVMHDGSRPYTGVLETVQHLKRAGKKLVILSNSSKRRENSVRMLTKLGFDHNDFDQIITSGEVCYRMLAGDKTLECDTWPTLSRIMENGSESKKVFVFGSGTEDEEYCTSSGWALSPVEEADLILARGTFTINDGSGNIVRKNDNEEEYFRVLEESLKAAALRKIPMLVSNPDKVRPDEGLPPMPGAIGDAYEEALGDDASHLVKRVGKPFREVYDLALRGQSDSSIACMIGDALETDVTGGSIVGCTTVWVVKDGIHGPDIMEMGGGSLETGSCELLRQFNSKDGTYANEKVLSPDICLPHFRW